MQIVKQIREKTIAAFRPRHHRALGDLFVQTVKLARRAGLIKEVFGLRQFLLRGLDKVGSIWRFTCGVHKLMKLFRARFRVRLA